MLHVSCGWCSSLIPVPKQTIHHFAQHDYTIQCIVAKDVYDSPSQAMAPVAHTSHHVSKEWRVYTAHIHDPIFLWNEQQVGRHM
jgi:hypothetical protein